MRALQSRRLVPGNPPPADRLTALLRTHSHEARALQMYELFPHARKATRSAASGVFLATAGRCDAVGYCPREPSAVPAHQKQWSNSEATSKSRRPMLRVSRKISLHISFRALSLWSCAARWAETKASVVCPTRSLIARPPLLPQTLAMPVADRDALTSETAIEAFAPFSRAARAKMMRRISRRVIFLQIPQSEPNLAASISSQACPSSFLPDAGFGLFQPAFEFSVLSAGDMLTDTSDSEFSCVPAVFEVSGSDNELKSCGQTLALAAPLEGGTHGGAHLRPRGPGPLQLLVASA
eukprot:scaffold10267_cov116-Isochrysis_galbana.AAC.2